jgi:hypothetical protein
VIRDDALNVMTALIRNLLAAKTQEIGFVIDEVGFGSVGVNKSSF